MTDVHFVNQVNELCFVLSFFKPGVLLGINLLFSYSLAFLGEKKVQQIGRNIFYFLMTSYDTLLK